MARYLDAKVFLYLVLDAASSISGELTFSGVRGLTI
jgi:hypothetical protein